MIAKVIRARGYKGVCKYIFNHGNPELLGGNVAAHDSDTAIMDFNAVRSLRREILKPCLHIPLSLPVGDTLTPEQWTETAEKYMAHMDIDIQNHQWMLVRHSDKAHEHAHLIINKIGLDGILYDDSNTAYRSISACRDLEKALPYLRDCGNTYGNDFACPRATVPERKRKEVTGEDPTRLLIAGHVRTLITEAEEQGRKLTVQEFCGRLRMMGVDILPNIASTGKMNGFSFRYSHDLSGIGYTGSKLKAKWKDLQKRIEYLPERDNEYLKRLKENSVTDREEIILKRLNAIVADVSEEESEEREIPDKEKEEEKKEDEETGREGAGDTFGEEFEVRQTKEEIIMEELKKATEQKKRSITYAWLIEEIKKNGATEEDWHRACALWVDIDRGIDKDEEHREYVDAVMERIYRKDQCPEDYIPYTYALSRGWNDLDYSSGWDM
ncbi:MAG: relaxase/mobilization nuclease domain-containing protein [Synergistota bacterium]|nr:relaxase/mobilization nuclease domain-containing protein [Synergistota bacterium]